MGFDHNTLRQRAKPLQVPCTRGVPRSGVSIAFVAGFNGT